MQLDAVDDSDAMPYLRQATQAEALRLAAPELPFGAHMSWPQYVHRLERWRVGCDLPDDWVPHRFLVADALGDVVGRTSIRHALNGFLADEGGHIGFGVPHRNTGGMATRPKSSDRAS